MEMQTMQINIKINPQRDNEKRVRDLLCSLIDEANDNAFAISSANIDGEQVFDSAKGFINYLKVK